MAMAADGDEIDGGDAVSLSVGASYLDISLYLIMSLYLSLYLDMSLCLSLYLSLYLYLFVGASHLLKR